MLPSPDTLSVLVVDDDPAMLRTTSDVLRLRGYDPQTSESGQGAIVLAGQCAPAIAIIDLQLPDMNGLDLISSLHAYSALTQVIVLTGNATVTSAVQAVRQSIFDYLIKPIAPAQLGATLERAGERWRRHWAEAALRDSEQRFRSLIEHASDPILIVDGQGCIRYASPAHERVLAYSPEDLVGSSVFDILVPDDARILEESLRQLEERPELTVPIVLRCRSREGSVRTLSGCGRNLVGDSAIGGIVLNLTDVTDQLELEAQFRQSQKMEAVGRLAGGVAHDFNNLLTVITAYSDLAIEDIENGASLREDLAEIRKAADRASGLTRQLLAFSRRQVLRPRILDANEILKEIEKLLERLLGADIALTSSYDPALWQVQVDGGQLEQVVMNLAVNARDAMPQGGTLLMETANVQLTEPLLSSAGPVPPGSYVVIRVTDSGCGMDAEVHARLFEPFFTTKAAGHGTGLGLSTVYGIVRQSEGHVVVNSRIGAGSTFTVYLPRVEP